MIYDSFSHWKLSQSEEDILIQIVRWSILNCISRVTRSGQMNKCQLCPKSYFSKQKWKFASCWFSSEKSLSSLSLFHGYFCDKNGKVSSPLLSYYVSFHENENNLLLYPSLQFFKNSRSLQLKQNILRRTKVFVSWNNKKALYPEKSTKQSWA